MEMKNIFKKVLKLLLYPVVLLVGLCVVILFALYLPFDYFKYKRSAYCKTERKKYRPFAAFSVNFEVYNKIAAQGLPIKYLPSEEEDDISCGAFVFNKTLIIINFFTFTYDVQRNLWCCEYCDNDEIFTLDEYISLELEKANAKHADIEKAVVLIDSEEIADCFLEEAKKERRFLVSYGNVGEALKAFCEKEGDGM